MASTAAGRGASVVLGEGQNYQSLLNKLGLLNVVSGHNLPLVGQCGGKQSWKWSIQWHFALFTTARTVCLIAWTMRMCVLYADYAYVS